MYNLIFWNFDCFVCIQCIQWCILTHYILTEAASLTEPRAQQFRLVWLATLL